MNAKDGENGRRFSLCSCTLVVSHDSTRDSNFCVLLTSTGPRAFRFISSIFSKLSVSNRLEDRNAFDSSKLPGTSFPKIREPRKKNRGNRPRVGGQERSKVHLDCDLQRAERRGARGILILRFLAKSQPLCRCSVTDLGQHQRAPRPPSAVFVAALCLRSKAHSLSVLFAR